MRIAECVEVSAPPESVWAYIAEPENYLRFMSGVTRWEVESDRDTGIGARYRVLFRVGAAEVGGLIEVVEWEQASELAWTSVLGIDQRGRWRLRPLPAGGTRVELRLQYGVAGGGIWSWMAEQIAGPTVRGHASRTLAQLKRMVEQERLRSAAAERRAARA